MVFSVPLRSTKARPEMQLGPWLPKGKLVLWQMLKVPYIKFITLTDRNFT